MAMLVVAAPFDGDGGEGEDGADASELLHVVDRVAEKGAHEPGVGQVLHVLETSPSAKSGRVEGVGGGELEWVRRTR